MADERRRHQLYEELGTVLTKDSVDELMSYLPPVGWADVATKADVGMIRTEMGALRADLRGETGAMGAELKGEMADLRGEMGAMRAELKGEMTALRSEVSGNMAGAVGDLKLAMARWALATTLTVFLGVAGMIVTVLLAKP